MNRNTSYFFHGTRILKVDITILTRNANIFLIDLCLLTLCLNMYRLLQKTRNIFSLSILHVEIMKKVSIIPKFFNHKQLFEIHVKTSVEL